MLLIASGSQLLWVEVTKMRLVSPGAVNYCFFPYSSSGWMKAWCEWCRKDSDIKQRLNELIAKVLFVSKMLWLDQWDCLLTHSWRFRPHEQKRVVHLLEGQGGTAPCYSDRKLECEEPVWEHTGRCTFEIIHLFAHLSNKCYGMSGTTQALNKALGM